MPVSPEELAHLANLAKLDFNAAESNQLQTKIDYFLTLAEQLNRVDVQSVAPLTHPLDLQQPLRDDHASATCNQTQTSQLSDHVRDNLYTVPAVLD